jgi:hypothetical protein
MLFLGKALPTNHFGAMQGLSGDWGGSRIQHSESFPNTRLPPKQCSLILKNEKSFQAI